MFINRLAETLKGFLRWLLSKDAIADLGMSRSTFWRRTAWIWEIWPIAPATGEVHDVVYLDGIWLGRRAVVLIARAGRHVIAWQLARSECAVSWAALMMRIPEPVMAVSDGSTGLAKAAGLVWPGTRIQRCTFHVANQVKRYTTLRPRLEAGIELLGIANRLKDVKDVGGASEWIASYSDWCTRWDSFLREFTIKDGKRIWAHERLRKARGSLNRLVRDGTLFAFIEVGQRHGGRWPSTNNAIESVNSQIRDMLRLHRGLPFMHQVKAIFWWCLMHTEAPPSCAEALRLLPRDDDVEGLFRVASSRNRKESGAPVEYDTAIVWEEFHMPTRYRR